MECKDNRDISISTDGIMKLKPPYQAREIIDPIDYLLIQNPQDRPANYLDILRDNLVSNLNYIQYDDMGIIRLIP